MQLWIQHMVSDNDEMMFSVSNGMTSTNAVSLKHLDPVNYPISGYRDKALLSELAWYLESYLYFPAGADAERAAAVQRALRSWGSAVFDALFQQRAYQWYDSARNDLRELEIKIISADPAVLSWPWEAIYSGDDGYLAQHCCMERQPPDLAPLPPEVPDGEQELHMLFVVSRPDTSEKAGYHTLEREVVRHIRDNGYAVTVDVLRPPTFDNLRRTLEAKRGYYHIVHFDGHGGYGPAPTAGAPGIIGRPESYQAVEGKLIFETDVPGEPVKADPVGAETLGQLLNNCGVPMMVLNACQSAMIDGQAKDAFASVAAQLLRAGIPSVTAMGYSLFMSAAKHFVPAFYEALFRDGGPAGAMRAGRQAMYAHPERPCWFGETPLQDWVVPVLYQQFPAGKRLLPKVGSVAKRNETFPKALWTIGDYGLIGRGREIHDLERILHRNRQAGILIHGMAGAGKTTLAKGFLHWLRDTSGLREPDGTDCPVFWFEFQEIHSVEAVLNRLADALLGETARTQEPEALLERLTEVLKNRRVYMVWDNFESASGIEGTSVTAFLSDADRHMLKRLLKGLRDGKTRVFITSRRKEDWLSTMECVRMETLGGLYGDERWEYCRKVVLDLGRTIDRDDPNTEDLLDRLGGNPLALRVVLLRLGEGKTAGELLKALDSDFTGAEGDEGTEQMMKALRVLECGMDPAFIPVLEVIGLHEHFANEVWVTNILANMDGITETDSAEVRDMIDCVKRCFQMLENAGLCERETDDLYRLHPALRGSLSRLYSAPEDTERRFVKFLAHVEKQVHNDITTSMRVFSYHEADFLHAKALAEKLSLHEEDLRLSFGLASYAFDRFIMTLASERFQEMAEKAHRYDEFEMECRAYGILSAIATDRETELRWSRKAVEMWNETEALSADVYLMFGVNAQFQGNFSDAEMYFRKALNVDEQNEDWGKVCAVFCTLGDLAREQNDLKTAEIWYQKCLQMARYLGKKGVPLQAAASSALGRIALSRGDIPEALNHYREALRVCVDLHNLLSIAVTLYDLGSVHIVMGSYGEAREMLMESTRIADSIKNKELTAKNYNALGVLSEAQKDYTSAKLWFEKALSMFDKLKDVKNAAIARQNLERAIADGGADGD